MAYLVSARLDYSNQGNKISYPEMEHEVRYLKRREQVGAAGAIIGTVLAMLAIAGVLGAGHIIFGALAAIALFAALYAYLCRQAASSLQIKQIDRLRDETPMTPMDPSAPPEPEEGVPPQTKQD